MIVMVSIRCGRIRGSMIALQMMNGHCDGSLMITYLGSVMIVWNLECLGCLNFKTQYKSVTR